MRQGGGSRWMKYRAQQRIDVNACRFAWQAHTGPAGLIKVRDALSDCGGDLVVKALGILPIAHTADSHEVTRGVLMRYLAEIAWAPDAIIHNHSFQWRVEKPDTFVVTAATKKCSGTCCSAPRWRGTDRHGIRSR